MTSAMDLLHNPAAAKAYIARRTSDLASFLSLYPWSRHVEGVLVLAYQGHTLYWHIAGDRCKYEVILVNVNDPVIIETQEQFFAFCLARYW